MIRLDYIVTGTGRCGTLFASNYLTSAGIPCTHEAVFTPKGINFAWSVLAGNDKPISSKVSKGDNLSDYEIDIFAESSYMSAPFLSDFPQPKVIHMIRNPIKVIGSFLGFKYFSKPYPIDLEINPDHKLYEEFMYWSLPELAEEMPQLDRACLYWAGWNEMIEKSGRVEYRHRLEDPIENLAGFLGSEGTYNKVSNALPEARPKWSMSQIQNRNIKNRLKELAKKYGYFSILY